LTMSYACKEDTIDENGTGTLTGTVVSEGDNMPIENVRISTTPASNTVFTNAAGKFVIQNIQVGEYSVQADMDDFLPAFEAANINFAGEEVNVVFELMESTAGNRPPSSPELIYPPDNATDIPLIVDFSWSATDPDNDDISYTLEVLNGSDSEVLLFEEIQDTTFTVQNLRIGVNYFWQVEASDGINPPVQSEVSSFRTMDENTNRFLYVREVNGNNVIFSGADTDDDDDGPNENEIQLTSENKNSFKPRKNNTAGLVAFLRTEGPETHLFSMKPDGSEIRQITSTVPVAGFRQDEIEYTWFNSGSKLYYPNFNKLYAINSNGTGNQLVYETPPNEFITEIAVNEIDNRVVLKTNNALGYEVKIMVIDPETDTILTTVIENELGAFGGIDYAANGNRVLFTQDVSGFQNGNYRILDARIFEHDLTTGVSIEIDTDKQAGTNDLDAKYSPSEGGVIFVNTPNDGVSQQDIFVARFGAIVVKELVFTQAFMPDWE